MILIIAHSRKNCFDANLPKNLKQVIRACLQQASINEKFHIMTCINNELHCITDFTSNDWSTT